MSKKKKEHVTFDQMHKPKERLDLKGVNRNMLKQNGYQQMASNQRRTMMTKRPTAR